MLLNITFKFSKSFVFISAQVQTLALQFGFFILNGPQLCVHSLDLRRDVLHAVHVLQLLLQVSDHELRVSNPLLPVHLLRLLQTQVLSDVIHLAVDRDDSDQSVF